MCPFTTEGIKRYPLERRTHTMEQNKTIEKEIADVLLSISKVANRLAALFASGIKSKGVDKNVEYEQSISTDSRVE